MFRGNPTKQRRCQAIEQIAIDRQYCNKTISTSHKVVGQTVDCVCLNIKQMSYDYISNSVLIYDGHTCRVLLAKPKFIATFWYFPPVYMTLFCIRFLCHLLWLSKGQTHNKIWLLWLALVIDTLILHWLLILQKIGTSNLNCFILSMEKCLNFFLVVDCFCLKAINVYL